MGKQIVMGEVVRSPDVVHNLHVCVCGGGGGGSILTTVIVVYI